MPEKKPLPAVPPLGPKTAKKQDTRLKDLKDSAAALEHQMNSTVKQLTDGYEHRCYGFEIFETSRKISLVCLPKLLAAGSVEQLLFGIVISFASFAMYTAYAPFKKDDNDVLSIVCQTQIFLALLASIILLAGPPPPLLTLALPVMLVFPALIMILYTFGVVDRLKKVPDARCTKIIVAFLTAHLDAVLAKIFGHSLFFIVDDNAGAIGKELEDYVNPVFTFKDLGETVRIKGNRVWTGKKAEKPEGVPIYVKFKTDPSKTHGTTLDVFGKLTELETDWGVASLEGDRVLEKQHPGGIKGKEVIRIALAVDSNGLGKLFELETPTNMDPQGTPKDPDYKKYIAVAASYLGYPNGNTTVASLSEAMTAFHLEQSSAVLKIVNHYSKELRAKMENDKRPIPKEPKMEPLVNQVELDNAFKARQVAIGATVHMRELIKAMTKHSADGDGEMTSAMDGLRKAVASLNELGVVKAAGVSDIKSLAMMAAEVDKVKLLTSWDELLYASVAQARDTATALLSLRNAIKKTMASIGESAVLAKKRNDAALEAGNNMWQRRRSLLLGGAADIKNAKVQIDKSATDSANQMQILLVYAQRAVDLRAEETEGLSIRQWAFGSLIA